MPPQAAQQTDDSQYIKLPDGSYGKFRADATDDDIRSAIARDFPSAFQSQQKPQGVLGKLWSGAKGAGEQALGAIFGAGGMGQGGLSTADPQAAQAFQQQLAAQSKSPLNPLNYLGEGSAGGNMAGQAGQDLKAMNPVGPAFNNPNMAEGIGQSAANLLMLRQNLTGKTPVGGMRPEQTAEVAQPLNRQPAASLSVDQLLKNALDALNKKYPQSKVAAEASKTEAAPPPQNLIKLLRQSIAAAQAK